MYTYSIIITRNGQEIKKFLDFLPVLSIYFSIECQLLLEVKNVLTSTAGVRPSGRVLIHSVKGVLFIVIVFYLHNCKINWFVTTWIMLKNKQTKNKKRKIGCVVKSTYHEKCRFYAVDIKL